MTDEMILKSSDKAAQYVTNLSGWVDRHGKFWGDDESQARWSGCTHIECEKCGEIRERNRYCRPCYEKSKIEKYNAMPREKWDGETPLYSQTDDECFFSEDDLRHHIEETEQTAEQLRLIICTPNNFRTLDSEYFCDELPEDVEMPPELEEAIDKLNAVICDQAPASWSPGKYAADCDL